MRVMTSEVTLLAKWKGTETREELGMRPQTVYSSRVTRIT